MHQKIMPKKIHQHILTLDFHYVKSKVKINESFRLKNNEKHLKLL